MRSDSHTVGALQLGDADHRVYRIDAAQMGKHRERDPTFFVFLRLFSYVLGAFAQHFFDFADVEMLFSPDLDLPEALGCGKPLIEPVNCGVKRVQPFVLSVDNRGCAAVGRPQESIAGFQTLDELGDLMIIGDGVLSDATDVGIVFNYIAALFAALQRSSII